MNDHTSSSTDASLLAHVQADDARAWEQFVELYGPLLYSWARRGGLTNEDAADVTQESFLAIARAISRFDPRTPNGSLRGWLWTIVGNKIRDLQRERPPAAGLGGTDFQRLVQSWPEEPPSDDEPESAAQTRALFQRALAQVQAEFEPKTWDAFWRVVVGGQATDAVAADLGLSPNGVRQAKSRVLRRLRGQIGPWPNL